MPRLAVRCRGLVRASWAYPREIACEFKLFRGGNAGGVAASAQPSSPGSLAGAAEAARNKVLERMAVQGVWSRERVKESREEPIWLAPRQMPQLATAVFANDAR